METQPKKDLLQKLIKLEKSQKHLEHETSLLQISKELRQRSHSLAPYRPARKNISEGAPVWRKSGAASFRHASPLMKESRIEDSINLRAGVDGWGPSAGKFTDEQYLNILQSTGQSVHALDLELRIIFWNAMAEKLYGYSAAEIVGKNPINVIVDERDAAFAMNIAQRCVNNGESWSGEFPVKGKLGETFSAVITISPFYDDDGSLIGIICITVNTSPFLNPRISAKLKAQEGVTSTSPARSSFDSDQPIQVTIASKISSLASKVRSKMRAGESSVTLSKGGSEDSRQSEHGFVSAARGDFIHSPFSVFTFTYHHDKFPFKISRYFTDEIDGKSAIHKVLTSKAEQWIANKCFSWPWKGNEQEGSKERPTLSVWPWAQNEQDKDDEASSPWSSTINANSISSTNSCGVPTTEV